MTFHWQILYLSRDICLKPISNLVSSDNKQRTFTSRKTKLNADCSYTPHVTQSPRVSDKGRRSARRVNSSSSFIKFHHVFRLFDVLPHKYCSEHRYIGWSGIYNRAFALGNVKIDANHVRPSETCLYILRRFIYDRKNIAKQDNSNIILRATGTARFSSWRRINIIASEAEQTSKVEGAY